jgi:hypothetical protein
MQAEDRQARIAEAAVEWNTARLVASERRGVAVAALRERCAGLLDGMLDDGVGFPCWRVNPASAFCISSGSAPDDWCDECRAGFPAYVAYRAAVYRRQARLRVLQRLCDPLTPVRPRKHQPDEPPRAIRVRDAHGAMSSK